jgi:hypothetical protein
MVPCICSGTATNGSRQQTLLSVRRLESLRTALVVLVPDFDAVRVARRRAKDRRTIDLVVSRVNHLDKLGRWGSRSDLCGEGAKRRGAEDCVVQHGCNTVMLLEVGIVVYVAAKEKEKGSGCVFIDSHLRSLTSLVGGKRHVMAGVITLTEGDCRSAWIEFMLSSISVSACDHGMRRLCAALGFESSERSLHVKLSVVLVNA